MQLQRVRGEFVRVIGARPHPAAVDLEACIEARCVYREALRLHGPAELLRVADAPTSLGGEGGPESPAGALVCLALREMHTDARYWVGDGCEGGGDGSNPARFNAGRWRAATRRSPVPAVPGAFAPFGGCPGRHLAELEFLIVLHAATAELDPHVSEDGRELQLVHAAMLSVAAPTPGTPGDRRAPRTLRTSGTR